jgi:DNA-binding NtrC family response regulator
VPLTLVVDPDSRFLSKLRPATESAGYGIIARTEFISARRDLQVRLPAALVANVRLASFNGIHLAYVAKQARPDTRAMVYDVQVDRVLASEARRAGAFFERQTFVPYSLERFLTASLPTSDRRDVVTIDRRGLFRGGRRTTDVDVLRAAYTD